MSKVVFSYIRNSLHMPWVKLDMIIDDLETLFFILFWPGLLMYTAEHLSDRCEASIVKSGHFFNMEQLSSHRVFDRVPYYGPYTIEIPQIKSLFVWKMLIKIEKDSITLIMTLTWCAYVVSRKYQINAFLLQNQIA